MSDPNSPKAAGWAGATPSLSPKLRLLLRPGRRSPAAPDTYYDLRRPFIASPLNFVGGLGSYGAGGPISVPHAPSCATLSASGAGGSSAISSSSSSLGSGSLMGYLWPVKKISYSATTVDGLRLHATRARCPAAAAPRPGLHPVMLVPGLASSSEATWDITPELSLLDHLARQGFDVWAVDLRGALPRGRGHVSSALIQLCAP